MPTEYKEKQEQRKWNNTTVKVLRPRKKNVWAQCIKPYVGKTFMVEKPYVSANKHIVYLQLKGVPDLAFDAYKDVKES